MDILDFFRIVNIVLALSAAYPSFFLLRYLINGRKNVIPGAKREVNSLLIFIFMAIATASFLNLFIVFFIIAFNGNHHSIVASTRTVIVQAGLSGVSWLFYLFIRKL